MLLSEALEWASDKLAAAEVTSPSVDAELLATHVLQVDKSQVPILCITGQELGSQELSEFQDLVTRRAERIPLQHLTGRAFFRQLELKVGKGVFIPRPETESVVSLAVELIANIPEPTIADFCAGSGAIAISLATEISGSNVFAVEKSEDAIAYLKSNFEKYGLDSAKVILGDVADVFQGEGEILDLLISNPPYIPNAAIPIDLEVRLHDPSLALYGGEDGLDLIKVIAQRAKVLLKQGGYLVLEHSDQQGQAVVELLLAEGWESVTSHKDLTTRDRMVSARRP